MKSVSVIVPVYNEEMNVGPLAERTGAALAAAGLEWELIFVDDGSTDATWARLEELAAREPRLRILGLSRNFGQTAALQAGIDAARYEAVVPMDGDLQNDPQDIPRLLERLAEGADVVSGWRRDRQDPFLRSLLSRLANRLIGRLSGLELHDHGCSLKAYRRERLQNLCLYGEVHRFIPLLLFWEGARVEEMPVQHHPRHGGTSKYGFARVFKLVLDLLTQSFMNNYLTKPNYVFGGCGLLCGLLSVVSFAVICYRVFALNRLVATPLIFIWVFLSFSSVILFLMGFLAEMLTRLYYTTEARRPYRLRRRLN